MHGLRRRQSRLSDFWGGHRQEKGGGIRLISRHLPRIPGMPDRAGHCLPDLQSLTAICVRRGIRSLHVKSGDDSKDAGQRTPPDVVQTLELEGATVGSPSTGFQQSFAVSTSKWTARYSLKGFTKQSIVLVDPGIRATLCCTDCTRDK